MTVAAQRKNVVSVLPNTELIKQDYAAVTVHVRLMFLRVGK